MIKFALLSAQASFDIPQALTIGQPGEGYATVLVEIDKLLDLEVAGNQSIFGKLRIIC